MKIDAEYFEKCVGRPPEMDDLERCNCDKAGEILHQQCGWNHEKQLPVFMSKIDDFVIDDRQESGVTVKDVGVGFLIKSAFGQEIYLSNEVFDKMKALHRG